VREGPGELAGSDHGYGEGHVMFLGRM